MQRLSDWIKQRIPGRFRRSATLPFTDLFSKFQLILALNNQVLETIASANDKLSGDYIFDQHYIHVTCDKLEELVQKLIYNLDIIAPGKFPALHRAFQDIQADIDGIMAGRLLSPDPDFIVPYNRIGRDFIDAVGGKNAHLAELHTFLGLRVPAGFAITCSAFGAFMEYNGLVEQVEKITGAWLKGTIELEHASETIKQKVLAGRLPGRLEKEIAGAVNALAEKIPDRKLFLAVRSSAWGEDSEHSFAGQYLTLLNEPVSDLPKAYLRVLASAYDSGAMEYRRRKGFKESEVSMAVGCQIMIDAKASGVLYSLNPLNPETGTMQINSTWGLGASVVSGQVTSDQYVVERRPPHIGSEIKVVRKSSTLVSLPPGGTAVRPVEADRQTSPSLTKKQIRKLAEIGLLIEKYFKKPQDIEFAIDKDNNIIILQARQLAIETRKAPRAAELPDLTRKYQVLFKGRGSIAQKGIASGPVHLINSDADLKNFPAGAILVSKSASPLLAKVMAKASGIITDIGSATGHLATIAREFRVPALLDTSVATTILQPGQEITLDAEENVVYQGTVEELKYYGLIEESIEETYEYRLLRRVLKKIEPLHLLDPAEKSFVPAACRTLHDITRFVHEKAVETIIDQNYYQRHDPQTVAGKLQWNIPLDLVIIDIGGGIRERGEKNGNILPRQVCSKPMLALLKGLEHPGAWDNEPMSVDFGSFMSSLTRTRPTELSNPKQIGQNLAVISREYANVSLRLGYHFTMIDSYITENINDNYAYFRFFGGVTDITRRSRRARFLGEVLESHDFRVELHGDLVVARIKKLDERSMRQRLYLLGFLVGFTRQLDVKMISEEHISGYVEKIKTLLEDTHEQD